MGSRAEPVPPGFGGREGSHRLPGSPDIRVGASARLISRATEGDRGRRDRT